VSGCARNTRDKRAQHFWGFPLYRPALWGFPLSCPLDEKRSLIKIIFK